MSIKPDTFLSKCKIAKIKPLFEKGIKTEAKIYRPISLKINSRSNTGLCSKKWTVVHLSVRL